VPLHAPRRALLRGIAPIREQRRQSAPRLRHRSLVFLSGLPLGLVNGRSIRRGDLGTALEKSVTRAGTPYGITGGLTLITARRHGDLSR